MRRKDKVLRSVFGAGLALCAVVLAVCDTVAGETNRRTETDGGAILTEVCRGAEAPGEEARQGKKALPARFDLREKGVILDVSDQGDQKTCWAFASASALATSMPKELQVPLSADHMANKNSFGLKPEDGGDYSIASAYLLAWQGPVAEADDPYGDAYSPEGLQPVCHVQTIKILGEKDYEAVKRAVYETGAVQSSLYMPPGSRKDQTAFYYSGANEANHDVVIVGWDDGYSRENFVNQPSGDGAFLCMNSWGESFGDDGYFYVSYEDSQIGRHNVSYAGVERADNYSRIYQTDLCGWTGQLGYGSPSAWFANVYTTAADGDVTAAGFYATKPETEYEVFVVPLSGTDAPGKVLGGLAGQNAGEGTDAGMRSDAGMQTDAGKKTDAGTSADSEHLVARGKVSEAGFYTISWEKGVPVKAGSRFAVAVKIDSPGAVEPVAIEYKNNGRLSNIDIGDGEGYISYDGIRWERAEENNGCNVCLKAYTREN